jgi:hypothetical protein
MVVTPLLAGSVDLSHKNYTIPDASGRPQILQEAPVKLRYPKTDTPFFAPKHDFIGQVLGESMNPYGLPNGELVLCQNMSSNIQIKPGDKIVCKATGDGVHQDWQCLRDVVSVDGNKVVLRSYKDGENRIEKNRPLSDITAKVIPYDMPRPKRTPFSVLDM